MTPRRPDWDTYFLGVAQAVSARADCTRRAVGAVLVDEGHRIKSTGYNGSPSGAAGCLTDAACPRGLMLYSEVPAHASYTEGAGRCIAIHAETNALIYAGLLTTDDEGYPTRATARPAERLTMYITRTPCRDCFEWLILTGVGRVVWPTGSTRLIAGPYLERTPK